MLFDRQGARSQNPGARRPLGRIAGSGEPKQELNGPAHKSHRSHKSHLLSRPQTRQVTPRRRVIREINAATQRVAESNGLIAGEIRLGFVNSVNVCWLPKMIGRFLRKYPDVRFSVESIDISELESRLLDEKLDLGVGFLENNRQTLKTLELFEENLVAIANAKCGIKSSRSINLEEIAAFPLVLLRSGFCTRELIEEELKRRDFQPTILAEFDSIDGIVSCVQEVTAISVLPEHACHWPAYPGIRVIPLTGNRWKRSVGLITPRIAEPLPAVSCFVDFLRVNSPKAR